MVSLLLALQLVDPHSYIILLNNLREAVKSGKISKALLREIIRLMRQRGLFVPPYLVEATKGN
jgi:hypothetical protein